MPYDATRPMAEQPSGDLSLLPAMPDDTSLPDEIRLVMSALGSAAKICGCWVEVSAPALISQLEGIQYLPFMHPTAWMMVYQDQSKVAKFFRQAEQQGLVTSSSGEAGYFYAPTQKLVEMMLRTTQ